MNTLTIARPQVEIDAAVQELVRLQPVRCTIVHCRLFLEMPSQVRIWPTTFLVEEGGERKKLIKAFNISISPEWTLHNTFEGWARFTLVFEGLEKGCERFHLFEDISEPGCFYSKMVERNASDVYTVEVFA